MTISPEWMKVFPDDRSREAYRKAMLARTPLSWEVIEDSQSDLLRLLVGRVSANVGTQVILGLSMLFREHPKAEQASQALLGTIMHDVVPPRARTLLIAISDAWTAAWRQPPHKSHKLIRDALERAVRRLVVMDIDSSERNALRSIQDMLAET